jgi:hypothetical protein
MFHYNYSPSQRQTPFDADDTHDEFGYPRWCSQPASPPFLQYEIETAAKFYKVSSEKALSEEQQLLLQKLPWELPPTEADLYRRRFVFVVLRPANDPCSTLCRRTCT